VAGSSTAKGTRRPSSQVSRAGCHIATVDTLFLGIAQRSTTRITRASIARWIVAIKTSSARAELAAGIEAPGGRSDMSSRDVSLRRAGFRAGVRTEGVGVVGRLWRVGELVDDHDAAESGPVEALVIGQDVLVEDLQDAPVGLAHRRCRHSPRAFPVPTRDESFGVVKRLSPEVATMRLVKWLRRRS
jgi:hypothetical protein